MDERRRVVIVPKTFLGYELDSTQDLYVNYLTPTIIGCIFYITHFACDLGVTYRHFYDENVVWASLTLFFVYLPVILCFVITISSWELWAEEVGCGPNNIKWFTLKFVQHLAFPIWSMWRYAEKLFWCIEGIRNRDDDDVRDEAITMLNAPRTIEFYFFLQGYVHTIPQIFLQLHILLRYLNETDKQTVDVQIMSLVMNIAKMAITTTLYQRFKTQKIGGRYYPWFKPYKYIYGTDTIDGVLRSKNLQSPYKRGIVYSTRNTKSKLENQYRTNVDVVDECDGGVRKIYDDDDDASDGSGSTTSSKYYLKPIDDHQQTKKPSYTMRETSIVGGPKRHLYTNYDVIDLPKRLYSVKALPEDDLAGKIISFMWWFTFILGRMLSISAFAYFYKNETVWLLSSHFVLIVSLLIYDSQANIMRKIKVIYYVFVGLLYLFVLIEFKTKFKKVKFWYYGFFTLIYTENITMCLVWWINNIDYLLNDYWFKYIFNLVLISIMLSLMSLLFYINVTKPKSVIVAEQVL